MNNCTDSLFSFFSIPSLPDHDQFNGVSIAVVYRRVTCQFKSTFCSGFPLCSSQGNAQEEQQLHDTMSRTSSEMHRFNPSVLSTSFLPQHQCNIPPSDDAVLSHRAPLLVHPPEEREWEWGEEEELCNCKSKMKMPRKWRWNCYGFLTLDSSVPSSTSSWTFIIIVPRPRSTLDLSLFAAGNAVPEQTAVFRRLFFFGEFLFFVFWKRTRRPTFIQDYTQKIQRATYNGSLIALVLAYYTIMATIKELPSAAHLQGYGSTLRTRKSRNTIMRCQFILGLMKKNTKW